VKRIHVEQRENPIVNRLNKTKVEKFPDLREEREARRAELRKRDQGALQAKVCSISYTRSLHTFLQNECLSNVPHAHHDALPRIFHKLIDSFVAPKCASFYAATGLRTAADSCAEKRGSTRSQGAQGARMAERPRLRRCLYRGEPRAEHQRESR
jgi:hypothetical protein